MQAFETTGTIDPTGRLTLDQPLHVAHSAKVRVIVLVSEGETATANGDLTEATEQDTSARSFLNMIDEIRAQVPDEEWKKLPTDLSKNIDHYLYGSPKIEE